MRYLFLFLQKIFNPPLLRGIFFETYDSMVCRKVFERSGDVPKSKYETHVVPYLDKIAKWAEQGASQAEIAGKLHLAVSTFKLYLSKGDKGEKPYSDLTDCFRLACEVPDDNVEAAMYKRACGITYDEETFELVKDEYTGELVERRTKRVRKYIPPDPTSGMFWLANRRPNKWRYRPEPSDGDDKGVSGVVELPAVMEKPEPPKEVAMDG